MWVRWFQLCCKRRLLHWRGDGGGGIGKEQIRYIYHPSTKHLRCYAYKKYDAKADRKTERQKDRKTERQKDRKTDRHTHTHTHTR